MPHFQLFYLRDVLIQKFRESAPLEKPYSLRPQDYEEGGSIEAPGPYGAWKQLQENSEKGDGRREFGVGDVLESEGSELIVLNYWGFDEAVWRLPHAEPEVSEAASNLETSAVSQS